MNLSGIVAKSLTAMLTLGMAVYNPSFSQESFTDTTHTNYGQSFFYFNRFKENSHPLDLISPINLIPRNILIDYDVSSSFFIPLTWIVGSNGFVVSGDVDFWEQTIVNDDLSSIVDRTLKGRLTLHLPTPDLNFELVTMYDKKGRPLVSASVRYFTNEDLESSSHRESKKDVVRQISVLNKKINQYDFDGNPILDFISDDYCLNDLLREMDIDYTNIRFLDLQVYTPSKIYVILAKLKSDEEKLKQEPEGIIVKPRPSDVTDLLSHFSLVAKMFQERGIVPDSARVCYDANFITLNLRAKEGGAYIDFSRHPLFKDYANGIYVDLGNYYPTTATLHTPFGMKIKVKQSN